MLITTRQNAETKKHYGEEFYSDQAKGSRGSAARILPFLCSGLGALSIVDVGAGVGTWLTVARECGMTDALGIEGEWVRLLAPEGIEYVYQDLNMRIEIARRFDFAICLEVAEHLEPSRSAGLVDDLCALSDMVLFGAAIPGQMGTGHINERWQSEWVRLFAARGWDCLDVVRPKFWNDRDVEPWYAQNAFLYVKHERLGDLPQEWRSAKPGIVDVVHPGVFDYYLANCGRPTLRFAGRLVLNRLGYRR